MTTRDGDPPSGYPAGEGSRPPGVRDAGERGVDLSAADQIRFIANIERILTEGNFVATYKYALLVTLVDLAIERGDDTDRELPLDLTMIAEKFAELYWRQAAPYSADEAAGIGMVLHQNSGKQASAIRMLSELRMVHPTIVAARRGPEWPRLIGKLRQLIKTMPLWRLQVIRSEHLEFLYRAGPGPDEITLLPSVARHLRQRALTIRRLAQTEWLGFLLSLPRNDGALGRAVGLSEFLFGSERSAVRVAFVDALRELQRSRCFYCDERMRSNVAVDHFIPWARYPRDVAHNLVLAHAGCNSAKRDTLASESHLARWTAFSRDFENEVGAAGSSAGIVSSRATAVCVARWSYASAEGTGALLWSSGKELVQASGDWRRHLAWST